MNIMLAFNNSYFFSAYTLIYSLCCHHTEQLTIYIFYHELSQENCEKLKAVEKTQHNVTILLIPFSKQLFQNLSLNSYPTIETYFRLIAWSYLPKEESRFLYLDADIIVQHSLHDFYYQDMHGNILAAVPDSDEIPTAIPLEQIMKNLEIPIKIRYCNAGVLLFDLDALRNFTTPDQMLSYCERHATHLIMDDQDIINGFFAGRIHYCSCEYNYSTKKNTWHQPKLPVNEVTILHYNTSLFKPYHLRYHGNYSNIFWHYARKATFCNSQYVIYRLLRPYGCIRNFLSDRLVRKILKPILRRIKNLM